MSIPFSEVYFKDFSDAKAYSVRDIKADKIGKLVTVRGIVTKATEVKPMIVVATYTCDECGSEVSQPVRKLILFLFYTFNNILCSNNIFCNFYNI